jgi:murein DD-endopeptidase MepM/ murein hydrolase activator NlpD
MSRYKSRRPLFGPSGAWHNSRTSISVLKMRAYRLCLAFLCALSASGITPAAAHITDYPFRLTTRASGAEQEVVARNDGPVPITVQVTLSRGFFASDRIVTAVVPPYTALPLGPVQSADESAGDHNFRFRFRFGRLDAVPDEQVAYRLPFEEGRSFAITQAYGGNLPTHNNTENLYAVDFAMPSGAPVVAARNGIVIDAVFHHREGGYNIAYWDKANTVSIVHDDGTVGEYAHLSPTAATIKPGQRVEAGQLIGYSGNTGYTSGPHLHFVVYKPVVRNGKLTRLSLPVVFYNYDPPIRFDPKTGMTATANYKSIAQTQLTQAPQSEPAHTGLNRPGIPGDFRV